MIAGAGAGAICTVVCAPLDVLKVRLQVQGQLGLNQYSDSLFRNTFQIFRDEGIRGAFKGVGPALLTVPIFWAVYWPIYNKMKSNFYQFHPDLPVYISHLLSAISAGAVGDIITNPFWVTRTRLQTLSMHKDRNIAKNISSFDMMRTIYRDEGWKAFYKGLGASILGLSHVAIQFPLYEYLKVLMRERIGDEGSMQMAGIVISSIISKLIASSISYPHEVLRSRLQDDRSPRVCESSNQKLSASRGLIPLLIHIIKYEGIGTFWVGLRINLIRVIPATISTFLSYEYLSAYLNSRSGK
eukprot:gene23513-31864_t